MLPRLDPPPPSDRPRSPIAITHILHPDTPGRSRRADRRDREPQRLRPIADAIQADRRCQPGAGRPACHRAATRGSCSSEAARTAPELHGLALRIADHLDGLASVGSTGVVAMAGIVLHVAASELLRHPSSDPWDRAATLYGGFWLAVGYHLVELRHYVHSRRHLDEQHADACALRARRSKPCTISRTRGKRRPRPCLHGPADLRHPARRMAKPGA